MVASAAPSHKAMLGGLPNACGLVLLCAGMTLLMTAYQEVQNAAPQNIKEVGLRNFGFYALAMFYTAMLFGTQVAPQIMDWLGGRNSLPTASVGFILFIGALLAVSRIPSEVVESSSVTVVVVVLLVTTLSGLLGGLLWPSQGYVLTHYAPPHLLNWYMSFFSLCICTSGFLGPALVASVLRLTGQHSVAVPLTLLLLGFIGLLLLCRLPPPDQVSEVPDTPGTSDQVSEVPDTPGTSNVKRARASSVLHLLTESSARRLGFVALAEGWCLNAFVSAMLPIMASSWTSTSSHLFHEHFQLLLMLNGLGHILASLLYAPIADRCGRRFILILQASMCLVAALLAELDLILGLDGFDLLDVAPLDLSAAFFIGFSIILARINNQAICANLYRERAGSAFAMLATLRGLASIGGMLLLPAISGSWSREIVAASLGWLFVSSIAAAFHSPLFKVAEVAGEKEEPSAEIETEGVA